MRLQVIIHAPRVRRQNHPVRRGHRALVFIGDLAEPQPTRFLVRFERRFSHHLRQLSSRQPPQRVHLPHTILRRCVALQKNRVLPRRGFNVGYAQRIARNRRPGRNRRGNFTRCFRQRTPRVPVNRAEKSNQQNRYAQIDRPKQW